MAGISGNQPESPQNAARSDSDRAVAVNIEQLHLRTSDIAEIRRLAETNPELAKALIDQKTQEDRRQHASHRFGLAVAATLAVVVVLTSAYTLVSLGWLQSIAFVAALLGLSHVLRVILKGEWSETSWFGRMISGKTESKD